VLARTGTFENPLRAVKTLSIPSDWQRPILSGCEVFLQSVPLGMVERSFVAAHKCSGIVTALPVEYPNV